MPQREQAGQHHCAARHERERMAMMLVDWHEFSVVRTIEFDDSEDVFALGKPTSTTAPTEGQQNDANPRSVNCK